MFGFEILARGVIRERPPLKRHKTCAQLARMSGRSEEFCDHSQPAVIGPPSAIAP
jgi:hypothetical protein